jgi:MFS family permease
LRSSKLAHLTPEWLLTYAGVILLMAVLINLFTSFAQHSYSLTIPSMRDSEHGLGLSYTQVTLLVTVVSAAKMGASFASGTLAPRYGIRPMIGIGTVLTGAAMFLLGLAPNFYIALAATALMGVGSGAALTPMMGLLAPWFEVRRRGVAAGLASAGASIGFVITGLMVPWLVDQSPDEGWRLTWFIFGGLTLAIGVLSLVFVHDRPGEPSEALSKAATSRHKGGAWPLVALKSPFVWLVTLLAFCAGWSLGIFTSLFGAYLSEENGIDLVVAGRLLVLIGVLSVGSGALWGGVSDRAGRGHAFLLVGLVQSIAFALFWLMPGMVVFVVSSVLIGLTLRAAYVICAASAGDYVPVHFAGSAFGLMSTGAGLGLTVSPVVGGMMADTVGMSWAFSLALAASVVAMVAGTVLHQMTATSHAVMAEPGR